MLTSLIYLKKSINGIINSNSILRLAYYNSEAPKTNFTERNGYKMKVVTVKAPKFMRPILKSIFKMGK